MLGEWTEVTIYISKKVHAQDGRSWPPILDDFSALQHNGDVEYFDLEICIVGTENSFKRTFSADVLSKHDASKCCEQSVVHLKFSCNPLSLLIKLIPRHIFDFRFLETCLR